MKKATDPSEKQVKNPISRQAENDKERCLLLCRWLLDRWEETAILPEGPKQLDMHNALFGAKHSLMTALVELVALMLSLGGDGENAGMEAFPFGPVDLTVIEEFIRKARSL